MSTKALYVDLERYSSSCIIIQEVYVKVIDICYPACFLQSLLAVVSIAFPFRLYIAPENHRAETDCNR